MMSDSKSKKKHKKKRKQGDDEERDSDECLNSAKMSSFDSPVQQQKAVEENSQSPHHKKKKKKKHSEVNDDNNEVIVEHEDTTGNGREVESCTKAKKHKKKKNKHLENTAVSDDEEKKAASKSIETVDLDSSGERKKSKKKKKKRSKDKVDEENFSERSSNCSEGKTLDNSNSINEGDGHDSEDQLNKCKKKKSKKHKRKLPETSSQDNVFNNESTEPTNSKKVKLQSNLDSCSEQSKSSMPSNEPKQEAGGKSGQWSSAELGDTDRQNKFMRLLGGFKKGNDSSQIQKKFGFGLQSKGNLPYRPGGNFAMNKLQQDTYTKNLESDYERAMGMNLNRGIGLGFQKPPDEGKKFYIDTNSSKSVKFDD